MNQVWNPLGHNHFTVRVAELTKYIGRIHGFSETADACLVEKGTVPHDGLVVKIVILTDLVTSDKFIKRPKNIFIWQFDISWHPDKEVDNLSSRKLI